MEDESLEKLTRFQIREEEDEEEEICPFGW